MRSKLEVMPLVVHLHRMGLITAVLGLATLAPRMAVAKECRADADCGADFTCAKSCGTPGCSTPPNCPAPVVTCAEIGTCEPKYRPCSVASDCIAGLVCGPDPGGACWRSSTGESGCTEGAKVCTFEQATCTADDQCGAGFECASVGAAGCPEIFIPDAGPCNGEDIRACVPKRVPCDVAADCGPGSTCFEFAESRLGMPASWGTTAVKSCVSDALALALRGHAYFKGPGLSRGGVPEGTSGGGPGVGNGRPSGDSGDREAKPGGGACSMGGTRRESSWPPVVALLGALALSLRRARRR